MHYILAIRLNGDTPPFRKQSAGNGKICLKKHFLRIKNGFDSGIPSVHDKFNEASGFSTNHYYEANSHPLYSGFGGISPCFL